MFCFSLEGPLIAVAISTRKLVYPRWVWLERQFGDITTALRALPVALEHLALSAEAAASSSAPSASPERGALVAVALAATKVSYSARVWLERKFGNCGSALTACPVALVHLAVTASIIICHVASNLAIYILTFMTRSNMAQIKIPLLISNPAFDASLEYTKEGDERNNPSSCG